MITTWIQTWNLHTALLFLEKAQMGTKSFCLQLVIFQSTGNICFKERCRKTLKESRRRWGLRGALL